MFYKLIEKLNNSKKHPYYYISPLVYSIGDACEQITITSMKIKNKNIVVLHPIIFKNFLNYKLCNKFLFKNLKINSFNKKKNFFIFIIKFFLNLEFLFRRIRFLFLSKLINLKKIEYDSFPYVGIHSIYNENFVKPNFNEIESSDFSKVNIILENQKISFCEKILNEEKIPLENIVCLHVRDSGYKKDTNKKSYRNSNIKNYIELIKYLTNKNYYVLRMGDSTANFFDFSGKNFYNYSHSKISSGLMDLFLISKCKFFIGNQSGLLDTAYMYNKPTLTTNMCEIFCSYPRKSSDRGLFKKMKVKGEDKHINLIDYIKMDYSKHDPESEVLDFEFIENSPEELYESIVEFENLYKSKNFYLSKNQNKINEIIKKRFDETIYKDIVNVPENFNKLENSKIAFWVKSSKGSLCETYLKNIF